MGAARTSHKGDEAGPEAKLGAALRLRVPATELDALLGARDKEGAAILKDVESREIDVATVHDVERVGFRHDHIEDLDVSHFPIGNLNQSGDRAAEI